MPEAIARRQLQRVQSGRLSDLALHNRLGGVRLQMEEDVWWLLFDAVQEAREWDNLDEHWKTLLIAGEEELAKRFAK